MKTNTNNTSNTSNTSNTLATIGVAEQRARVQKLIHDKRFLQMYFSESAKYEFIKQKN
jgi:hypothetical protein